MTLEDIDVVGSPAWWMTKLARKLLDRDRLLRLGTLDAYRCGCPPLLNASDSERKAFYAFTRLARSNFARPIVRAPAQRMAVRAIRTAAADDESGDEVAWRYWTSGNLDIDSTDVHSEMLTFSDAYIRVGVDQTTGKPVPLRRDPRFIVTAEDPLNPHETIAAFELLWDEWAGMDYAYLWLPGKQYVATRPRSSRPPQFTVPGLGMEARKWSGFAWWPRLSFDPSAFTMRPDIADVPEDERDSKPYSETFDDDLMPVVRFPNRDGVGEFEEHLDLLDRINHTIMVRVVTAAVQAYKQRALEQDGNVTADRLPDKNPETGETIDWEEIFQPGPDSLWKLPPGVKIWESGEVQLQPILSAITDDLKQLAITTDTPFSIFTPDAVNQSAEGASGNKEMLIFKVEDRERIAARSWAKVISLMFRLAPDEDRYDDAGNDRADASKIIIDWFPADRYSLQEKAAADTGNKSLSADMAAAKIWGLTPDEVAINKAQRASDSLAQMVAAAGQTPGAQQAANGS